MAGKVIRRATCCTLLLAVAAIAAPAPASAAPARKWRAEPAWISNAGVYRKHEFVYQDYLYDDHGANTDGKDRLDLPFGAAGFDPRDPTDPRLSPAPEINWAGDFMYPSPDGEHYDNVADLTELRVAADSRAVHYRIRMGDMTAPDSSVVAICVNEDRNAGTGIGEWPHAAKITARLGCDRLYTVHGTGAEVTSARGTEDLKRLGGSVSAEPAKGYVHLSVPRSVADPGRGTWRYYVASGVWDAGAGEWAAPAPGPQQVGAPIATGGSPTAPAVWDLLSNNNEPNSTWDEERQANDLNTQDLLSHYVDVSFKRLAKSRNDPQPRRTGVIERIYVSKHPTKVGRGIDIDRSLGTNFVYEGPWQPYVLVLPKSYYRNPRKRYPFDQCLHPLRANHNVEVFYGAAFDRAGYNPLVTGVTPNTGYLPFDPFTAVIDRLDAVYACVLGRGEGVGYQGGDGMVDALEVARDVQANYRTDPERRFLHGVSLGAIGTWYLARLYPDRYAAAMPYIFSSDVTGGIENDPLLANLHNLPVFFSIGTGDEFGQGTQGDPQADQLEREGDEYVYLHYLGRQHEGRIENDFLPFAERLGYSRSRVRNPARVRFRFDPSRYSTKMPGDGSAYWVGGMKPREAGGTGEVDAVSLARAGQLPTDQVVFDGLYLNNDKGYRARFRGLLRMSPEEFSRAWRPEEIEHGWQQLSLDTEHTKLERPAARNGFTLKGTGLSAAVLDLKRMKIATRRSVTGELNLDGAQTLTLRGRWTGRETVLLDGKRIDATVGRRSLTVSLPQGEHRLKIRP